MYNNICGRLINGDLTLYISVIAIEESVLSLYQLTRKAKSKIFVTIYVRNWNFLLQVRWCVIIYISVSDNCLFYYWLLSVFLFVFLLNLSLFLIFICDNEYDYGFLNCVPWISWKTINVSSNEFSHLLDTRFAIKITLAKPLDCNKGKILIFK